MFRLRKRTFLFVLLFLLFNLGVAIWLYLFDLKTRFPNLDLHQARFGVASWYSETDKNIQKHTANGEVFNDQDLTCASWLHPFNERLLVINLLNGKWVVCRVNDRGPNKRLNREIDLTKAAFSRISRLKHGLLYVAVTPVEPKPKMK